jgi:hypothetical protein
MYAKSRNRQSEKTPVTRLRHSEHHVSVVTVMRATTEELWEAVFSVGSVQRLYLENRNRR